MHGITADNAAIISAVASIVYALISAISLLLLSRQIRDARRFGAAPALYALLKEHEDWMAAIRELDQRPADDPVVEKTIDDCLNFFERVEHLRAAGLLPEAVLKRAFGNLLTSYLADPRFVAVIRQNEAEYAEVLSLARHLGGR
jgi:hypothetical protein